MVKVFLLSGTEISPAESNSWDAFDPACAPPAEAWVMISTLVAMTLCRALSRVLGLVA
jgi:hypothetical protein